MDQNRSKKAKQLKSSDSKVTNKKKTSKSTSKSVNKTKSESKKEVAQPEPKKNAETVPVNNNPSFRENKVPVKLDLISKQIEKSEEILFNQNKVLSRVRELTSKINYLDKNFESIYYKSDVEDFNAKLVNNDESLQNVLGNLKYFNKDLENTKYLQEQNKNLKYKLEICEVEKEDKNLFYENKLNSFESQLGGEIYDFFGFLKNLNLNVAYNTPSINAKNLDDNQIVLFFATVKQILKALKHKHEDKEKDLKFLQYDKQNLLEELNMLKRKYEFNENSNNQIRIEEGKEDLTTSKTLQLEEQNRKTFSSERFLRGNNIY